MAMMKLMIFFTPWRCWGAYWLETLLADLIAKCWKKLMILFFANRYVGLHGHVASRSAKDHRCWGSHQACYLWQHVGGGGQNLQKPWKRWIKIWTPVRKSSAGERHVLQVSWGSGLHNWWRSSGSSGDEKCWLPRHEQRGHHQPCFWGEFGKLGGHHRLLGWFFVVLPIFRSPPSNGMFLYQCLEWPCVLVNSSMRTNMAFW